MRRMYLFVPFLFLIASTQAQDISGLWVIDRVSVGNQNMTPVARWTRFSSDSTYASGNGWHQNSVGSYHFDPTTEKLSMQNAFGVRDEFEPFSVTLTGNEMVWSRNENGAGVTVLLLRTDSLPMAPADFLLGVWKLQHVSNSDSENQEEADKDETSYFHFRPDGLYHRINPDGDRESGYWHVNGHRPELTLLPQSEKKKETKWTVSVNSKSLVLEKDAANDQTERHFTRVHSLP